MPTFLPDIKAYLGFDERDVEVLASLVPILAPHFAEISEHFYACILDHPGAHASITGGQEQVDRLKKTLVAWMESGLQGPHDQAFYERRARIGRRHVAIGLPQQYMVTAVGVMRQDYRRVISRALAGDIKAHARAMQSVDRLLDIELAIMLQTYRIDSEDRLRRGERLVTIGMIAAGIGHDLRNPLGVIESSVYLLRRQVEDERGRRHLDKINNQVRRCNRIVTALLELARSRPPTFVDIDAREMLRSAMTSVPLPEGVTVDALAEDDVVLRGDATLLEQVVVNLVTNSVEALRSRSGGHITVRIERFDAGHNAITVADDGPGFDADLLPQVFEPLVTSRASGVGLGLALVRNVADRHYGAAQAENRPGGGAVVRLLLPYDPASRVSESTESSS